MDEPNPYQSPPDQMPAVPSPQRPAPGSSLDFGRALSFFFQDPDWVKKLLLGSLFTVLGFFLVGLFFLAGYMMRVIRRSARGEAYPLPDWDDLGGIFTDGLLVAVAYLGYVIPLSMLFAVPALGIAAVANVDGDPSPVMALVGVIAIGVLTLFSLAVALYLPAVLTRLALKGNIGAAFEFEAIFAFIKRNAMNYILAILIAFVAQFISQFGIILFCVGIIPASFWATTVMANALGEVALRDPAPDAQPLATG
jgi:hypothetical protein